MTLSPRASSSPTESARSAGCSIATAVARAIHAAAAMIAWARMDAPSLVVCKGARRAALSNCLPQLADRELANARPSRPLLTRAAGALRGALRWLPVFCLT